MTPEKAKELLPVFAAYAEGKVVQWRPRQPRYCDEWLDYDPQRAHPSHNFDHSLEWRVKPAPLELWVCPVCKMIFEFEPKYCCRGGVLGKIHEDTAPVKMREVLP